MSLEFKGMKYTSVILAAAMALLPVGAAAQTEESLDPEVGGRVAFTLDKKIVKGLHVSIEEEVRFDNNFGAFDRFHTTLGASYKVLPYLKVGLGYSLINGYSSSNSAFKTPRHRAFVDVTGSYRFGDWTVSLRERVQMTHRTDSFNEYQNPANAWALKSRVKVTYKGLRRWEPYGFLRVAQYAQCADCQRGVQRGVRHLGLLQRQHLHHRWRSRMVSRRVQQHVRRPPARRPGCGIPHRPPEQAGCQPDGRLQHGEVGGRQRRRHQAESLHRGERPHGLALRGLQLRTLKIKN